MVYALVGPIVPGPAQALGRVVAEPRQPPLPDEPGHLRHRGRRGRDLRVPLRAVRRARHAHRPRPALHRHRVVDRRAATPAVRRRCRVFASALFGMLSGSSVANAVTVGSLTIPAMIRLGYPRHFAGGVEAASSTGGQITPPIMGAAAFLMIEFLNLPYSDDHHRGDRAGVHALLRRVHAGAFRGEAQRACAASRRRSCPTCRRRSTANWPTLIPLVLLDRDHRQRATRPTSRRSPASRRASLVGLFTSRGSARRARSTSRSLVVARACCSRSSRGSSATTTS